MDNKVKKKCKFGVVMIVVLMISSIAMANFQISLGKVNNNSQINNVYIPLKSTLEKLGFDNVKTNNNVSEFVKGNKKVSFINEENYNLKKDNNTYYSKVLNDTYFIKIAVLKDLGYKVDNDYFVSNKTDKLKLDTQALLEILENDYVLSEETDLPSSTSYFNHKILKQNIDIKELTDYTIENKNIMDYDSKELEAYIKANYNLNLKQYKKSLVSIDTKYPSSLRTTYDLLDNGQIIATIIDSNGKTYIELVIEIRNKVIFIEK